MTSFDLMSHPIILTPPKRLLWSGWSGHIPFGMLVIDLLRPEILVELGTHRGVSYCAFCQAIKELKLRTRCFAVDTWRGDNQTGGYGDEVYDDLKQYHDALYGEFSTLIRSTFHDASVFFKPHSVDLLHIDGNHTYEAVKQDFETWLPKMSKRGVILFHDISVTEEGFGVQQLWNELKLRYRSFELTHSFGLGLLVVGPEAESALECLLECTLEERRVIRALFQQLGRRLELEVDDSSLVNKVEAQINIIDAQKDTIMVLEAQLFDFYELARNPLFRVARAWQRYGALEFMKKLAMRLILRGSVAPNQG